MIQKTLLTIHGIGGCLVCDTEGISDATSTSKLLLPSLHVHQEPTCPARVCKAAAAHTSAACPAACEPAGGRWKWLPQGQPASAAAAAAHLLLASSMPAVTQARRGSASTACVAWNRAVDMSSTQPQRHLHTKATNTRLLVAMAVLTCRKGLQVQEMHGSISTQLQRCRQEHLVCLLERLAWWWQPGGKPEQHMVHIAPVSPPTPQGLLFVHLKAACPTAIRTHVPYPLPHPNNPHLKASCPAAGCWRSRRSRALYTWYCSPSAATYPASSPLDTLTATLSSGSSTAVAPMLADPV